MKNLLPTPTMQPDGPAISAACISQEPGAHPRSRMALPRRTTPNRFWISWSLYTDRAGYRSLRASRA